MSLSFGAGTEWPSGLARGRRGGGVSFRVEPEGGAVMGVASIAQLEGKLGLPLVHIGVFDGIGLVDFEAAGEVVAV